MKTKVSKTPFIAMLILTIIFAIVGSSMLFVNPYKGAPVQVSSKIGFVKGEDSYYWTGKIKNVSDKEVTIDGTNFIIILRLDDTLYDRTLETSYYDWFYELGGELTLQPNEEYSFEGQEIYSYSYQIPTQVYEVHYTVNIDNNNYNYTIYRSTIKGLTSGQVAILFAGYMLALLFLICAISVIVQLKNTEKRNVKINEYLATQEAGIIYVGGMISQSKGKGKAIGKTIASGLGAALSAAFLGIGFYKVYTNGTLIDFVITKDAILTNSPKSKEINPTSMRKVNKEQLINPTITINKKQVIMNVADEAKTTFVFNLNKCSSDKETLINTLKENYNATIK